LKSKLKKETLLIQNFYHCRIC